MGSAEMIRDLLTSSIAAEGLELWDVEMSRDVVRVLIDGPGGIDLDELAAVAARVVSPFLDEHPELTPVSRFQLEVSSPGVERTLRTTEQLLRYVGAEVTVKTTVAVHGARRHYGTLVAADESNVRLAPKDAPAGTLVDLPVDQIDRIRTVLTWGAGSGRPAATKDSKDPAHIKDAAS